MPLYQMYTPKDAFTPEEKLDLATRITSIYTGPEAREAIGFELPRFYTSVLFHEFDPYSFFVGGEPRDKFIQIEVVHIARLTETVAALNGETVEQLLAKYFALVDKALKPYIADRGYECEFHIEPAPHETWKIDGIEPPPPDSEAEKRWAKDNKSSPYTAALQTAQ
jgi:phenylpyruvate tautomerase PptA (4-oxalocrotonate tautomerase family)